jgi:sugar lactone lactonase YvrE
VDTTTHSVRLVPDARTGDYNAFGWSRDGRWLYVASRRGRLLAYRPGSKRPLVLPVKLHDSVMSVAGA